MSYPDFNYRLCEFGEVPNIDLFGTRDRIKMSPDRFLCDIGYTLSANLNEIFEDFKIWLMSRMVLESRTLKGLTSLIKYLVYLF